MLKEDYRAMNDGIAPGADLLLKTERRMREEMLNKTHARRIGRTAAIALAAVMVLTTAAFATGLAQDIFARMKGMYASDSVDYDRLSELADKELGEEKRDMENVGSIQVSLNQAYYDGYQLMLGVEYDERANVVLGLEDQNIALVTPGDPAFAGERHDPATAPVPVREEGEDWPHSDILPEYITHDMTEEQVRAFEKEYEETGVAGVVVYRAGLHDFVKIEGDVNGESCPDEDTHGNSGEGASWRYISFFELPEGCREKDSLEVSFGVSRHVLVCRADREGVWTALGEIGRQEATFTVARNDQQARFLEGGYQGKDYSAKAEVRLTPVGGHITVTVDAPREWKAAFDADSGDFIWDYVLILPDGSEESWALDSEWLSDTRLRIRGSFKRWEGMGELRLRPKYEAGGDHEDEEIVIAIPPVE